MHIDIYIYGYITGLSDCVHTSRPQIIRFACSSFVYRLCSKHTLSKHTIHNLQKKIKKNKIMAGMEKPEPSHQRCRARGVYKFIIYGFIVLSLCVDGCLHRQTHRPQPDQQRYIYICIHLYGIPADFRTYIYIDSVLVVIEFDLFVWISLYSQCSSVQVRRYLSVCAVVECALISSSGSSRWCMWCMC